MISRKESAVLGASNLGINRIMSALIGIFILLILLYLGRYTLLVATISIFLVSTIEYINLLRNKQRLKSPLTIFGIAYISLIFSLNLIYELPEGATLVLVTLLGTWIFDTAAYYIGTRWGKHKIIPKISPKKSIEGLIGGIAIVGILSVFIPSITGLQLSVELRIAWVTVISLSAFLGDVIESSFKRFVEVKDSSNIIPGHGGFLDRFDSLVLTSFLSFIFFWKVL